jgi:hypothetical protein
MLAGAELRLAWAARPVVITWSLEPDDGGRVPTRCPGSAVSGEFLVADLHTVVPGLLEVADVICCPARHGGDLPASALGQVLERYPGCAVAAAGSGADECRVGTRGWPVVTVTVRPDYRGPVARPVLAACFVYGWVAAGRPATVLESARLIVGPREVSARSAGAGDRGPGESLGYFLCPYRFFDFSVSRASSSSRSRMTSASAAPAAE